MDHTLHSPVKPHTGIMIILLGLGILSARRLPQSVITLLANPTPGGLILKRIMPFVVLGPMVLGWFKLWGQHAGLFTESSGEALISLIGISLFTALLWRVARKLNALEIQRIETETLLKSTLETAPDSIIVCNDKHQILFINEQTEKMFGYTRDELLGHSVEVLIPVPLRAAHTRHQQNYIQQPKIRSMGLGLDIMGRRKDGSQFPVEIALSPHQHQGQLIVTAAVRDVSERQQSKEALERQKRALAMLSSGNRTLLHSAEGDEIQLLQAMCQVVIEVGGFRMAWVGYKVDDEQKSVRVIAQAGFEQGYLEHAAISWGENERGQGPVGRAVRTGQMQIAKDIITDPYLTPWRENALKHGYRSIIALPLKDKDILFGVLSIYSEVDVFDDMEVSILDEMAADLSFGILTLRNSVLRKKAERDLKASYAMLESTLESSADGIVVTSLTGNILKYNQRFKDIWRLPITTDEISKCSRLVELVHGQLSDAHDFIERTHDMYEVPAAAFKDIIELKDGRVIELIGHPQYMDGEIVGRVCSLHDITEQRQHESQLTYLANHDALTGLPNRNLLSDRLHQAIAYTSRLDEKIALLFIDLDRFKLINDSLGHDFGDHVLIELAKRLSECLRDGDTVSRMGGDEFVILLPGVECKGDVVAVAQKLLEIIARPCLISDRELVLEASIGVALCPQDGNDVGILLKHADTAMYRAKDHGGNTFKFYNDGLDEQVSRHFEIAGQLQHAIERNEFLVYYQPQFDLKQGKTTGAEALIRWQHPTMGMISPFEFIPIAEESNMILKIGEWVAENVIRQCKAWLSEGLPLGNIAINISARQLDHSDIPQILSALMTRYDLDLALFTLELELTEGVLMKHPEQVIQTLSILKAMNFDISIDDFGTGYSSLAYLKRFPIDKLKIDRSFVKDTPDDLDDVAIASAIIMMAHELGIKVVAEGVETEAQFNLLKSKGCDVIQGYLTGRPMTAQAFEALLRSGD
jgi:diguanylate cyclase (GGDEF)-like protein/PAS domain S-box-containing protein